MYFAFGAASCESQEFVEEAVVETVVEIASASKSRAAVSVLDEEGVSRELKIEP